MSFYYYSVCHVCKKASTSLKKCSKCKILHYCSREHQLQDWKNHKDICHVITETNSLLEFNGEGPDEFNKFKIITAVVWHFNIARELTTSEHEMWMFPKVCAVCYKLEVNIVCTVCWSVAYCSPQHRQAHEKEHRRFCPKLKLCLEIHQRMHNTELEWERVLFDFKNEATKLPGNITEVVKLMKFQSKIKYWESPVNLILLTDFFCSVVNIIYALEKSKFVEKRVGRKTKLVIHTTSTELCEDTSWVILMEFLSHWIQNLKGVKIFVFTPALEEPQRLFFTLNCDDCRKKRFTASVSFLEGEYHDFIGSIPRPDLVVMFNSNIPDVGTYEWCESMPKIIAYKGTPIMLTSYTREELKKAVEKFPPQWIKYYIKPQENKYGSLRPYRNCEEGSDPVIYRNSHVAIITKK